MKKIRKTFKAVFAILKNPWLLNKVLNTPELWDEYVKKNYKLDMGLPVIPFKYFFNNTVDSIFPYSFSDGGSLPTDILLLKSIAARYKDCRYFEIGTWRGESVANVAEVAKECFTLNLSPEEMKSMNLRNEYIEQTAMLSSSIENITHLSGNSLNFDFSSVNKNFDLVFIDGEHHYDYVLNDTKKVFANLIHENTIIVWHDYAFSPEEIRNQVLAGILDGTPVSLHKYLYHVQGTKSAVFIREEIESYPLQKLAKPEYLFEVKMKLIQQK